MSRPLGPVLYLPQDRGLANQLLSTYHDPFGSSTGLLTHVTGILGYLQPPRKDSLALAGPPGPPRRAHNSQQTGSAAKKLQEHV